MHASSDYELLDFGDGRKLERFGGVILDRPSPAADGAAKARPDGWRDATARYDRTHSDQGAWTPKKAILQKWNISFALDAQSGRDPTQRRLGTAITLQLQASPFGHVGVFPEQLDNWRWIARQAAKRQAEFGRPLRVLNLFAYTGGSTLAAAAAGTEVVHIDAARNIVQRARRNAELSQLSDRPIRWIAEDASRFCQRELKRGKRYDAVILDPPTYGHGPQGESWKFAEHVLPLLRMCAELTAESRALVLMTSHTPGIGQAELAAYVAQGFFGGCSQPPETGELFVATSGGRRLPSGVFARWPG
ncbi:MAG TPA: class I SAM-dependent methyltransferase [Lacipirellulaceae bacterium]|jgi:23S rRNA (cytosine1962-C5)-methyltransferase|nr:class I SAM-dependent methyltransferase [Lacipirellulaceae bacterium]